MGKSNELKSFQVNADSFICSILPGISHPQVQYSPGMHHYQSTYIITSVYLISLCLYMLNNINSPHEQVVLSLKLEEVTCSM